ncbi:beta-ketoacyl-ACP synthase [Methylobacterium radiotolerans]|uniref:Beta-ketoacyl synthase n=1 Tax=Methylobacterium radiotolerans (strain ATCC 27329 / DSM 1819 / JCM 2831 / NBRC 15690 / NCIMB 10815 / 0-1) TaxID=426355 RepID=B1M5M2_METRJ|nr:beta-ketoacyl-ACP synthase [Methylobacterium radiotolerans]ACB25052.1 Beta-ketoacyl synthase [Methylobacterium radiotolerans JCM 2831]KIU32210.1 3-oxoacyl-ACP synthase [Methylobacterium radiotolerans]UIY39957.1 beta-ketoacyl-ACP synthase [Methylobacterium radiotolerans]GEM96313.1 beta-ketoacyl-ACP synthase II [Methylobacterium radiotolerans]
MSARSYRDARGRPLVAVTGLGVVSSLGQGQADTWAAMTEGRSGIHTIARFPTDNLRTRIAGTVDFLDTDPLVAPLLSERFAAVAAEEAVAQAGIGARGDFPGALFIAVPPVEMEWPQRQALAEAAGGDGPVDYAGLLRAAATRRFDPWHDLFIFGTVADRIADRFGTKGSPISLSTACSSGATAIQLGVEAIRRGETAAALCIGTDGSVNPESLIRFSLLSALSTRNDDPATASKPFSKDRDGFVMGEGAAALVLEDAEAAVARGAAILGYVLGCGEKGDGFHRTRSSPDGAPIIAAIRASLDDAGVAAEAIDTVNAHGTSTPENDKMEALGLAAVFGDRAAALPVTSNKSMIGHTLTAAGAIEAAVSLLTIRHGRIPPTINHRVPDPTIALDIVETARDLPVRTVLSNSFGFGGQNTCLVLGAEPA